MSSSDTTTTHVVDLERGVLRRSSVPDNDDGGDSVTFSDADEGSVYSQFYSTADGSYDDYGYEGVSDAEIGEAEEEEERASAAAESDCSVVDIESGVVEKKVHLVGKIDRDCRICHLGLDSGGGIAIELGCSCKDDLAAAHKHCAETWFKIRGNKTCEICQSIARNVVDVNNVETQHQVSPETVDNNNVVSATSMSASTEARSCLNGHRFLNFLLACMVFAFVISWLFHFNIPS